MKACCLLLWSWVLWTNVATAQSVLLMHRPLAGDFAVEPLWNYQKETAAFTGSAEIWGIVHCAACNSTEQPSIEMSLQHANDPAQIVSFVLKPLSLASANWHPSLQLGLSGILQSSHWYAFRLTPSPAVKSGYDGVNFGEVFYEASQQPKRQLFRYKMLAGQEEKQLTINFAQNKQPWEDVWPRYLQYKNLVEQLDNLERVQSAEKSKCTPLDYAQVEIWGNQAKGIKTELANSDLELFKAVEALKTITENLPATFRPSLKRQLHVLLRLDISILEASDLAKHTLLIKRKASLLKELSLYPSLQPILKEYNNATGSAVQQERELSAQKQALGRIAKQLQPYQGIYNRIQKLQDRLDYLDQQLSTFD